MIKKGLKAIEFLQDVRQLLLLLLEASIELLHLGERLGPLLHQTQAGFGITLPARDVSLAVAKGAGLQPGAHRPGPMSTDRCRHGQLNGVQPLQPDPKPIEARQGDILLQMQVQAGGRTVGQILSHAGECAAEALLRTPAGAGWGREPARPADSWGPLKRASLNRHQPTGAPLWATSNCSHTTRSRRSSQAVRQRWAWVGSASTTRWRPASTGAAKPLRAPTHTVILSPTGECTAATGQQGGLGAGMGWCKHNAWRSDYRLWRSGDGSADWGVLA